MVKHLLNIFLFILFSFNTANASTINLKSYYDCGGIYSHSYFPQSVANEITNNKESIGIKTILKFQDKKV